MQVKYSHYHVYVKAKFSISFAFVNYVCGYSILYPTSQVPKSTAVLISRMMKYRKKSIGYRSRQFSLTIPKVPDVFIAIIISAMCDAFSLWDDDVGKHHRWYLETGKHCASGEKAAVKSTIMTVLSFGTLWMRISPMWVMLSEGHLEQSSWLPPWAPTAGHPLFLPASAPAHSAMSCTCQAPRRDLMYLLIRQSFVYHRKIPIYWLRSLKREN